MRDALSDEEWAELREAIAVWRTAKRIIVGGLGAVMLQTASLIGWGVSVETRFAAEAVSANQMISDNQRQDQALRHAIAELREAQREMSAKIDRLTESMLSHRAVDRREAAR